MVMIKHNVCMLDRAMVATHTHMHMHTHTYTHIYTHILFLLLFFFLLLLSTTIKVMWSSYGCTVWKDQDITSDGWHLWTARHWIVLCWSSIGNDLSARNLCHLRSLVRLNDLLFTTQCNLFSTVGIWTCSIGPCRLRRTHTHTHTICTHATHTFTCLITHTHH